MIHAIGMKPKSSGDTKVDGAGGCGLGVDDGQNLRSNINIFLLTKVEETQCVHDLMARRWEANVQHESQSWKGGWITVRVGSG